MDMAIETRRPSAPRSPQAPSPGTLSWAGFYLLAPVLCALPLGWYGGGIAAQFPLAASMLLWVAICSLSWWFSDLGARTVALLAPLRRLPVLCLTVGYLLNLLLSSSYNPMVLDWMVDGGLVARTAAIEDYFALDRNLLDPAYLRLLLAAGVPGLLVWLAGNYIFELITGTPRIRQPRSSVAPAKAADDEIPVVPLPPRFLQRMTRLVGLGIDDILAVEAEDHYIHVHTTRGKELVYYRFGDALEELAALDGLRIHRSAWVSRKAIERVEGDGRNLHVLLGNGERFRVSQSNRGAVLNARLGKPR